MNFFPAFLTRNTREKTSQHFKRLIWRWKYVGGLNRVIYKKKRKKNLKMKFFFFLNKENSTALQKANVMVELSWGISSVIYKKKES